MKKTSIITALLLGAMLTGCTTLTRLGITEDHVVTGVQLALAKRDLTGAVTPAQLREIIAIVKAEQRLQEIGEEVAADNRVQALIEEIVGRYIVDGEVVVPADKPYAPAYGGIPDAVDFSLLNWKYGGSAGKGAVIDERVQIELRKIEPHKIHYKFLSGLNAWGLEHQQADALIAAFVLNDKGEWVGGKFDWVSTSREDRSFENVYEGYNGWSLSGVPNPTQLALVVYNKNGSRRSNVVVGEWRR